MKKIRVGVIGIGHLGNYHLQKYSLLPQAEITAVADQIPARALEAAGKYSCLGVADYREIIDKVDAVSISVPTGEHFSVARDFLQAGVDVLLEKPITDNLAHADELIALARENERVFQVGMIERFNPAVMALDRLNIRPLFIEAHRLHPYQERGVEVDVVLDLMIHDLDIMLKFVQSPVLSVDAAGVAVLSEKTDITNARITFACGCIANVTASRLSLKRMQKIRFFEHGGYHSIDYQARDLMSLRIDKSPQGKRGILENRQEILRHDPLEEEVRSFLEAVRERKSPVVTGKAGRDALALALMITGNMKTVAGDKT
ncbi:MAG: Gfo/Idh/MocA family oxidoreductase [Smithellaceae bacterium]|nr:Gfo/Idh/MocA family oxidoreductase [Smithellaceae bacterium]